jgi:hypothetical protein
MATIARIAAMKRRQHTGTLLPIRHIEGDIKMITVMLVNRFMHSVAVLFRGVRQTATACSAALGCHGLGKRFVKND